MSFELEQGYVLGNPKTDTFLDDNSRISFAYHLTLIPKELYEVSWWHIFYSLSLSLSLPCFLRQAHRILAAEVIVHTSKCGYSCPNETVSTLRLNFYFSLAVWTRPKSWSFLMGFWTTHQNCIWYNSWSIYFPCNLFDRKF